ncbi:MAG: BRCT domain-containing protein [Bacteriovoracaceae bacterium]
MVKKGLIKNIPDLYKLKEKDFLTLDKVKDKLATKFYYEIQKSKNVDLVTFCTALGLSGGAKTKCEKIIRSGFNTISKIKNLTVEELQTVESFAEKSASEIVKSINEKSQLIDSLLDVGFNIEIKETTLSNKLQGQKFCITGELSEKRNVIEERIRNHGGVIVSSVSKNTDYLLTNEVNSTSSKFKKAQELKIKIINENDFNELIAVL